MDQIWILQTPARPRGMCVAERVADKQGRVGGIQRRRPAASTNYSTVGRVKHGYFVRAVEKPDGWRIGWRADRRFGRVMADHNVHVLGDDLEEGVGGSLLLLVLLLALGPGGRADLKVTPFLPFLQAFAHFCKTGHG